MTEVVRGAARVTEVAAPMRGAAPVTDSAAAPIPVTVTTETTVKATPQRPENFRTLMVVYGTFALGGVYLFYLLVGWRWGLAIAAFALFEMWTLINSYREDTISEAIWYFSDRPIIPLLAGILIGTATWTGYLGEPRSVMRGLAIGGLACHFWFQRNWTRGTTTTTKETAS